ncbi:transposase DNA-binding-containing protein [Polymorphobacter multimanifer]|uniref:transposase DNA-binding-containing protein n=1 Tax=Polymorphobacter multimanifer TaxID=1070431 RepID=UPI003570D8B1
MGGTIPLACQDWASTKAAYWFFFNPKVEEGDILAGHFEVTRVPMRHRKGRCCFFRIRPSSPISAGTHATSASPKA